MCCPWAASGRGTAIVAARSTQSLGRMNAFRASLRLPVRVGLSFLAVYIVAYAYLLCTYLFVAPRDQIVAVAFLGAPTTMRPNNALERSREQRDRAVLALDCWLGSAEWSPCLAAQQYR